MYCSQKVGDIKLLKMYELEKMSNPSETTRVISQTNFDKTFALQFGWYILSCDLHAVLFRQGVDTQISQESGMAKDLFQITKLKRKHSPRFI